MKKFKVLHIFADARGGINSVVENFTLSDSKTLEHIPLLMKKDFAIFDRMKYYIIFLRRYYQQYQSADLIHLHGGWLLHLLPLLKKSKKPLLISPHGAFHKMSMQKSTFKKKLVLGLYMKRVYQNADCFHALTKYEAQDIKKMSFGKQPIAVIPNGIDMSDTSISENKVKDLKNIANGRRVYLSLSRIEHAKGIENIIDAFAKLIQINKNIVLFIAGYGEVEYINFMKQKIKDLDLEKSIYLLGKLTGVDKNSAYEVADVFINGSYHEGFGLTILEAFRQMTPVIATTGTTFSELGDIKAGWYVPPSFEGVFDAMKKASELSDNELEKMADNGNRWIKENFSMETVIKRYEALYYWLYDGGDKPSFVFI